MLLNGQGIRNAVQGKEGERVRYRVGEGVKMRPFARKADPCHEMRLQHPR